MNLFELFIKIGIDDQASKGISSLTKKLGSGVVQASKVALKAVTAVSTGVAALSTSAIKQYAEYEQLVGGVDTLFKESSQKVQEYADNAYKTAGMSANEYMSTVTSFSASLLQSLGGDTNAVAEYANQALTDMSDNANKMGTSIDSIVQTYQSLSRGNFAMLDNLKLGYGGTKAELERLIADAAKLDDSIDANSMSFANVVKAIHTVQTEMGITGTTAKEAASTIQGSVGMMKAAWKNLSRSLADENGDIESRIEEFSESVSTVFDNVAPRIEVALNGVLQLMESLIPKIANALPNLLSRFLPNLINTAINIIRSLANSIKNNAGEIVDAAKKVVFNFIDGVVDSLPDIIDAINEIVGEIIEILPELVSKIVNAIPKIISSVLDGINKGGQIIVRAIASWFTDLPDMTEKAIEQFKVTMSEFVSFGDLMNKAASKTVDLSKSLSDSGRTLSEIDSEIERVEGQITTILSEALKKQQSLRDEDIRKIKEYNAEIRALENEKLGIYRDQQLAELRSAEYGIEGATAQELAVFAGEAKSALESANAAVNKIYDQELINLENYYKATGKTGTKAYQDDIARLEAQRKEELEINKKYYTDTIGLISAQQAVVAQEVLSTFVPLQEQTDYMNNFLDKLNEDWWVDAGEWLEGNEYWMRMFGVVDKQFADYIDAVDEIDYATSNAFIHMAAEMKANGEVVGSETKEVVSTMLSSFQDLPGSMGETAKNGLLLMIDGMEEYIPELKYASEMTIDEIVSAINAYLSKGDAEATGENYMESVGDGFTNGAVTAEEKAKLAAQRVAKAFGSSIGSMLGGAVGKINFTMVNGSHANGLSYVPYDGYIAQLHKGERVLTASEARGYGDTSIGNITINIDGARYDDEHSLAEAIAEEIQALTDRRAAVYA